MNDIVHIALAADHNYLPGLKATLASMLLHSAGRGRLQFHVFADGLSADDMAEVRALAADFGAKREIDFVIPDMSPIKAHFAPYKHSHAAFLRLYICDFMADLDWIVYSDVDVLWFRDACDLWEERNPAVSIQWSKDLTSVAQGVSTGTDGREWREAIDPGRYACSGVALMNLARMRERRLPESCAAFAAKWGTPGFVDQDILNYVLRDDAALLDQRWDCMNPDCAAPRGVVVHCNGCGRLFNGPYESWRPLYNIWLSFYFRNILGREYRISRIKRILFLLASVFCPFGRAARLPAFIFGAHRCDNFRRTVFFAWLRTRLPKPVKPIAGTEKNQGGDSL